MRKIVLAALAAIALVCAPSAQAQQQTTPYAGRGPNTLTFSVVAQNDTATIYLTGSSWATVYWTITTAGSGAITTEISLDGGTNWIASAYSKRIDAVAANPSIAPWANNGPVAGTFETPLPGNATAFRIRYQTAGTATSGTLTPGLPYAPGVPVVATLYSVLSAANTALDTGILDTSGWSSLFYYFAASGGTPAFAVQFVREDGVAVSATSAAVSFAGGFGPGAVLGGTVALSSTAMTLPARTEFTSGAIVGQTSRILVQARR